MTRSFVATAAALMLATLSQPEDRSSSAEAQPVAQSIAPMPTTAIAEYTEQATAEFAGGQPVTAEEVAAMVHTTRGAQGAVAVLDANGSKTRWTTFLAGIASGAPEWLAPARGGAAG